ncbi:MAG: DoxX family protein [Actinomycetes bacterium]|jgi:uncharacterized membrane protein|nr:MAG: hypothetical protein DIU67_00965 [Actinomycetota bacterium]
MNTVLWVAQGLLAVAFLAAGFAKATMKEEELPKKLPWTEDFPTPVVRLIGVFEILGALGLVLPMLLDVAPMLTPWAAVGLAVIQLGAAVTDARRGESQMIVVNLVLLALAVFVAVNRF